MTGVVAAVVVATTAAVGTGAGATLGGARCIWACPAANIAAADGDSSVLAVSMGAGAAAAVAAAAGETTGAAGLADVPAAMGGAAGAAVEVAESAAVVSLRTCSR